MVDGAVASGLVAASVVLRALSEMLVVMHSIHANSAEDTRSDQLNI